MGKRTIHHMDFDALVGVNRAVVALTGEPHGYADADGEKLASVVKEVEARADNASTEEAITEKASLLVFRVASGQYFKAGNKRTALVSGLAFLMKNGYALDLKSGPFVSTVDRVGMAAATLDDLYAVIGELMAKAKAERRKWDTLVAAIIETNREFLTGLAV